MGTTSIAASERPVLGFIRLFLPLVPLHKQFLQMQTRAMNIPSSSSGRHPHETIYWTSSDPPKLPRHWECLLPLSMTQEVELWGSSLLTLLIKELVIRHSAMSSPDASDVVQLANQATTTTFLASLVHKLSGMEKRPDKTTAHTWIRNFFAFVFEEYGFGGARAWACQLFEGRIKVFCKRLMAKEGT